MTVMTMAALVFVAQSPPVQEYTKAPELRNPAAVQAALLQKYPAVLRDAGIGDTVRVLIFVDAGGTVQSSRIDKPSRFPSLNTAALDVVRVMDFNPAVTGTQQVATWVALPLVFHSRIADDAAGPAGQSGTAQQVSASGAAALANSREMADRLFNRVMAASERGDAAEAGTFGPMAIAAYRSIRSLDVDARLHLGLIHLALGNTLGAKAEADSIEQLSRTHLFAPLLRAKVAEAEPNADAAAVAHVILRAYWDTEHAKGLPEYSDHAPLLQEARTTADRLASGSLASSREPGAAAGAVVGMAIGGRLPPQQGYRGSAAAERPAPEAYGDGTFPEAELEAPPSPVDERPAWLRFAEQLTDSLAARVLANAQRRAARVSAPPPAARAPAPSAAPARQPPLWDPAPESASRPPSGEPFQRYRSVGPTRPGPTRIMIYTTSMSVGAISVFVDDMVQGGLIHALPSRPSCGAPGTITVPVRPGQHQLYAEAAGRRASWGPVIRMVAEGDCYVWRLDPGPEGSPRSGAAAPPARRGVAILGVWTRRDEELYVTANGYPIGWIPEYFLSGTPDCSRAEVRTTRFAGGERVRIEVRRSSSHTAPVIFSDVVTLPEEGCYTYELR